MASTSSAASAGSKEERSAGWLSVVAAAEKFVRDELADNDASHDFFHIDRVRKLALSLAYDELALSRQPAAASSSNEHQQAALQLCLLSIELGALLHDIKDWKYSGSDDAGSQAARQFLLAQQATQLGATVLTEQIIDRVCLIVRWIGFKNELRADGKRPEMFPELAIVQDADRLDAIGAIGVARCLTFGGAKHRVLYDPAIKPISGISLEQYKQQHAEVPSETPKGNDESKAAGANAVKPQQSTTINHFYEKLLKLRDLMKTKSGRNRAEARHAFMVTFLEQFYGEWNGDR